uniref:Uncharacterized protein n=1 Tax=Ciona intestinalis TaxID=7719 RepID=H2Y0Q9_CIOIN
MPKSEHIYPTITLPYTLLCYSKLKLNSLYTFVISRLV